MMISDCQEIHDEDMFSEWWDPISVRPQLQSNPYKFWVGSMLFNFSNPTGTAALNVNDILHLT